MSNRNTPKVREGRIVVTPDLAKEMLTSNNYIKQRSVVKTHVDTLASEMSNGNWTPGTQLAFCMLPDKSMTLVNGQHRLSAVIKSGQTIEFQVLVIEVKSEDEVHQAYYRFDTVQRRRSASTVVNSTGVAKAWGVTKASATAAYIAGGIIASGLRIVHSSKIDVRLGTPDGKLDAIEPWWPYVKQYDAAIGKAPRPIRERFQIPSIMAVGLVTFRYQPARAQEFWLGAASDDGLSQGDPRKVLVRILTLGVGKNAPIDSYLIYAAHCWDGWFLGKTLTHVKFHENSVCAPLGTPFAPVKSKRS